MAVTARMQVLGNKVNRLWFDFFRYTDCFGGFYGSYLFLIGLISRLLPRVGTREMSVRVPGFSTRVFVRPGSSDVSVFSAIYRDREYEWDFTAPPSLIVDAGAYTGLSTAFFAIRYPSARIIAIEPDEQHFKLLMRNTRGLANVYAINAALWAESGQVTLTDPGRGAWGFTVRQAGQLEKDVDGTPAKRHEYPVRAITMSELVRDHKIDRIDLLKLDVEGSEVEIFACADDWITIVDAICLELHDRFRPGCSRSFFEAVDGFPIEFRRGEDVIVLRDRSCLIPQ